MGTKCSCQAKCFILLALVSSTHTPFSSGRTVGYFSRKSSRNSLDPFLPSVLLGGTSGQRQVSSIVNAYLLDTEIVHCRKHRNMSLTDPEKCFLSRSPASFFQAGLRLTKSLAPGVPRRPGAGSQKTQCREAQAGAVYQVFSSIRWCATKPKCVSRHVKDGKRWNIHKISLNLQGLTDL